MRVEFRDFLEPLFSGKFADSVVILHGVFCGCVEILSTSFTAF